jgi:hypothetical protein
MIRAIVMGHRIPAGALGPEPVQLDVRAYLVAHASGVILVDTGMDAGGLALDAALGEAGAAWHDVWTAPGILEAVKPGRMQGHGGTAEVSGGAA